MVICPHYRPLLVTLLAAGSEGADVQLIRNTSPDNRYKIRVRAVGGGVPSSSSATQTITMGGELKLF
jgi:hypothetical protein